MVHQIKIVVEKTSDGYVAHALDLNGLGEVNTQAEALADVKSAIRFHIGTFGKYDHDQAYFWTEECQKGEREADEDIKAGRVKRFKSAAEAVKYLHRKD